MMAATQRSPHPFAPLVLDDAGSLEAMVAAVMRLHSTLMKVGRCYTTDATGDRAALELGRVESVLAGAFCTIFGQSPADRFADILDQVTYVAEHMVKDHIFEDGNKCTSLVFALSVLRLAGSPVVLSDSPSPKTTSTTPGSRTSYPETARPAGSPKSCAAVALRARVTRRPYRIKPSARQLLNGLDTTWKSPAPCAAMCTSLRFAPSPAMTALSTSPIPRTGVLATAS